MGAMTDGPKYSTEDYVIPADDGKGVKIQKREGFLFDCVEMCIEEGSRNCILGPSSLTSSLLRILAKKLKPVEGTVQHASGMNVGYCDLQHVIKLVSTAGESMTALEFLMEHYPQKSESEVRGHLTGFGLTPKCHGKTPLRYLSGGETFRFALALTMMADPPVLFFDHPTSSLDVESVQALAYGLRQWNGTVVMCSLDGSFLRSLDDMKYYIIVPEEGKLRRIVEDGGIYGIDAYLKTFSTTARR
jgi:ATPase subunit of ABC transporter with duplicated ATPase domains